MERRLPGLLLICVFGREITHLVTVRPAGDGRPSGEPLVTAHSGEAIIRRTQRAVMLTHMAKRTAAPVSAGAVIGALGVVFGDIGTSPLYTYQTVVNTPHGTLDRDLIMGTTSMIIWALLLVVTVLYTRLLMRADNAGEGGLLALFGLLRLRSRNARVVAVCAALAMVGAATFLGDAVITPAVSVLSAVEGLESADTGLASAVVPIAVVILAALFLLQRFGTDRIGRLFGPIMIIWFLVAAVLGLFSLVRTPEVLQALSPHWIVFLVAHQPWVAFVALGGVVLAITGAEALYADMGHFGRRPIVLAWLAVVFPALVVNYLGQGAEVLRTPNDAANPFWTLVPDRATIPMVVLATLATIIASQAVISGSFSVVHQAGRLGLLPHLQVKHTSTHNSRQIFLPAVNTMVAVAVLTLVLTFRSSAALTDAYGLAVTITIVITTVIYLVLRQTERRWSPGFFVAAGILVVMLFFLAANLLKIPTGGWLPLGIAGVLVTIMGIWTWGDRRMHAALQSDASTAEHSIDAALAELRKGHRVAGTAVYLTQTAGIAPLGFRAMIDFTRALHRVVLILRVSVSDQAVLPPTGRTSVVPHGTGVFEIECRVGYYERFTVPELIAAVRDAHPELADTDPRTTHFVLSHVSPRHRSSALVLSWRQRIFSALHRLGPARADVLGLPTDRTISVGRDVSF